MCPMNPSGVQLISPIVPPGRQTRSSSSAVSWWCGANMTPTQDITVSNAPSAKGSASASASCQRSSAPRAAASRCPTSISSGVRSEAITSPPASAAGMAAFPDPAAMSSTRSPRFTPQASTRTGPRAPTTSLATAE